MEVRTILTPAEIAGLPARDLRGVVCVVFDVLRATSTLAAALASGARGVYPALTIEEARSLRRDRFPDALLGGERGGWKIDGFDLGNSPGEYGPEVVAGRDVIATTTNGTVALRACAGADATLGAGLVNLAATAAFLRAREPAVETLMLVCAGTGQDFALEDGLAIGALAALLTGATVDDATAAMAALYARHRGDLVSSLQDSANGRRLSALGLGADVAWCARESVLDEVALLRDGVMRSARNLLLSTEPRTNTDLPPAPNLE